MRADLAGAFFEPFAENGGRVWVVRDREIDGVRYWLAILVLQSIFDANLFVQVILARFCAHF